METESESTRKETPKWREREPLPWRHFGFPRLKTIGGQRRKLRQIGQLKQFSEKIFPVSLGMCASPDELRIAKQPGESFQQQQPSPYGLSTCTNCAREAPFANAKQRGKLTCKREGSFLCQTEDSGSFGHTDNGSNNWNSNYNYSCYSWPGSANRVAGQCDGRTGQTNKLVI